MTTQRGHIVTTIRRIIAVTACTAVALLAGCSSEGPSEPETSVDPIERGFPADVVPDDVELHDNVYWISGEMLEAAAIQKDRLVFEEKPERLESLSPGDVMVTDYGDGFWRVLEGWTKTDNGDVALTRNARLSEVVRHGEFTFAWGGDDRRPDDDLRTRHSALASSCDSGSCVAALEFSGDYRDPLTRTQGSLAVNASTADVDFRPAVRFRLAVDEGEELEELQVSGKAKLDLAWDLKAQTTSSMRQAFEVLYLGSDVGLVTWEHSPGEDLIHNVDPNDVANGIGGSTPMSLTYKTTPMEQIEVSYAGRTKTYTGFDPYDGTVENPTGGVVLEDFRDWLLEEFSGTGLTTQVIGSNSKAVLRVAVAGDNFTTFTILGKTYTARPSVKALYDVGAVTRGEIRTGLRGEYYLKAGYSCSTKDGCTTLSAPPEKASNKLTPRFDHLSGEPTINLRLGLRAGVTISTEGSEHASATPLVLDFDSSTSIRPPHCPHDTTAELGSKAMRQGRSFARDKVVVFEENSIVSAVPGCTTGNTGAAKCATCQGDESCIEQTCGSNHGCVYGRCAKAGVHTVTLLWETADPAADLDLYVKLPSGDVISKETQKGPGAEFVLESAGPVCEGCGGACEGSLTMPCDMETPTAGECPLLCETQSSSLSGFCFGSLQTVSCSEYEFPCAPECTMECENEEITSCKCVGTGYEDVCSGFDENKCNSFEMCDWGAPKDIYCTGGVITCDQLDESMCESASDCSWKGGELAGNIPPYAEQVTFFGELSGVHYAWVVNSSGATPAEPVPYSLIFDVDDEESFRLRGEVEPGADSRSVSFKITP